VTDISEQRMAAAVIETNRLKEATPVPAEEVKIGKRNRKISPE